MRPIHILITYSATAFRLQLYCPNIHLPCVPEGKNLDALSCRPFQSIDVACFVSSATAFGLQQHCPNTQLHAPAMCPEGKVLDVLPSRPLQGVDVARDRAEHDLQLSIAIHVASSGGLQNDFGTLRLVVEAVKLRSARNQTTTPVTLQLHQVPVRSGCANAGSVSYALYSATPLELQLHQMPVRSGCAGGSSSTIYSIFLFLSYILLGSGYTTHLCDQAAHVAAPDLFPKAVETGHVAACVNCSSR